MHKQRFTTLPRGNMKTLVGPKYPLICLMCMPNVADANDPWIVRQNYSKYAQFTFFHIEENITGETFTYMCSILVWFHTCIMIVRILEYQSRATYTVCDYQN